MQKNTVLSDLCHRVFDLKILPEVISKILFYSNCQVSTPCELTSCIGFNLFYELSS